MKKFLIFTAIFLLPACSQVPEFQRPAMSVPEQWRGEKTSAGEDLINWWAKLKSPELTMLEEKVLKQNLDLKAARYRIDQAKAAQGVTNAVFFPQLEATGGVSGSRSKIGGASATHTSKANGGVNISYALDLFGANRAVSTAADAEVAGSVFDKEALALVVSSQVAQTYAGALALKGRIFVARQSQSNLAKNLTILKARFAVGAVSIVDVEQQTMAIANSDAAIAALENNLTATVNALAVLTGEMPQQFEVSATSLSDMTVPSVAAGQPSFLLERRPDIRKAEADLIAANADIGAARAAFFPTVDLGAGAALSVSPFSSPATTALSIAGSFAAPLFKGGSLQSGLDKTVARKNELAEQYRQTVLVAFQEVEDALSTVKAAELRRKSYSESFVSADKAYRLIDQRFKAGAIDLTLLLNAERDVLAAKENLIAANLERLNAAIGLYQALGGGWKI